MVAIAGIDTRRLTRILREKRRARVCIWPVDAFDEAAAWLRARVSWSAGMDLAKAVTTGTVI